MISHTVYFIITVSHWQRSALLELLGHIKGDSVSRKGSRKFYTKVDIEQHLIFAQDLLQEKYQNPLTPPIFFF